MKLGTRLLITAAMVALAFGLANVDAGGFLIKKEDIPKAINKLKTGNAAEKIKSAKDLGARGAVKASDVKEAVDPLKALLTMDSNGGVRAAAAEALGKIAPEPPQETVQLLLKALKEDKQEEVKIASIIALGNFGKEASVALPEIRKIAQDKDKKKLSGVAKNVLKTLGKKN